VSELTASDGWDGSPFARRGLARARNRPRQRSEGRCRRGSPLLEFDSVHGRWSRDIRPGEGGFASKGARSASRNTRCPARCPGATSAWDIVIEASGKFTTTDSLQQLFRPRVPRVIVAAPVKGDVLNIVVGCNDHLYDPQTHRLVTAASCTTNCLAPVVKVIHEGLASSTARSRRSTT